MTDKLITTTEARTFAGMTLETSRRGREIILALADQLDAAHEGRLSNDAYLMAALTEVRAERDALREQLQQATKAHTGGRVH